MITLIHGDDIVSSRNYFYSVKSGTENPIVFDNNNYNLTDFLQSLSGKSLFAENKKIFLDRVFSSKKLAGEQLENVVSAINKSHSPIEIIIWEGSELPKTFLNQFPKANVKFFKLSQSLFAFLDSVRPNNPQNVILFHDALKNSDENMLFSMLVRQFRLLLSVSSNSNGIEETKKLAPWQIEKLQRQSRMFTNEQLKKIYNKLYETDLNIKTGVYPNLTNAIDILLLDV